MNKSKKITWKDVPRNQFSRGLHAAMFSEDKYCKLMKMVLTGDTSKKLYLIEYDKDYVIQWLVYKVCKPLNIIGLEELHKILDVAFKSMTENANFKSYKNL